MSKKTFRIVAKSVTQASNLQANVLEAMRIAARVGDGLVLIYIGNESETDKALLDKLIAQNKFGLSSIELVWTTGDPVDETLKVAEAKKVDLIITGAQSREGLIRYYAGSLTRQLIQAANCSVLLLTDSDELRSGGRFVVLLEDHPKTPYTLNVAASVASQIGYSEVTILKDERSVEEARHVDHKLENSGRFKEPLKSESIKIEQTLSKIRMENEHLQLLDKIAAGRGGYGIASSLESSKADLLVMNSPDTKIGFRDRVFSDKLEYILSELPCDLLIVHSHENKRMP